MSYVPETPPSDPELIPEYLLREFYRIKTELDQVHDHEVLHNAPLKPFEGMVRYSDGTDWATGSGAGLYEYRSGAWVKL
ncbi:MAG: hypothetical protein GY746_07455 [Gammaproteobacteria bacterium]|nr:hypothetical protein [Gammaproteobacteria bacterium]